MLATRLRLGRLLDPSLRLRLGVSDFGHGRVWAPPALRRVFNGLDRPTPSVRHSTRFRRRQTSRNRFARSPNQTSRRFQYFKNLQTSGNRFRWSQNPPQTLSMIIRRFNGSVRKNFQRLETCSPYVSNNFSGASADFTRFNYFLGASLIEGSFK